MTIEELAKYTIEVDNVKAEVSIVRSPSDYAPRYNLSISRVKPGTRAILKSIKDEVVRTVNITSDELTNPKLVENVKQKFMDKSEAVLKRMLPDIDENLKKSLIGVLVHDMFGLGDIEIALNDDNLEEVVINTATEPIWLYHKNFGWLMSNIRVPDDEQIKNYASSIGRKVGRQINNLEPLMDAHLTTGDRVNATLFPISTKGNTITIRKFARDPWTIVDFIDPKINTLNSEVAAFLWMCMQYELNIIIGGGTASGKTSFLNALAPFIPANHRVISIEDTRELRLPLFAHWIPMTTRQANAEGKGEVSMLDLMVNSLRMRPDRILVGEVRRQRQAEVMMEAMHTGHSVYSTVHANDVDELYSRLVNPPINIPETQLEALNIAVIQFRHRRRGIRRTYQIAEIVPTMQIGGTRKISTNMLYQWNSETDKVEKVEESMRVFNEISSFTGMSSKDIMNDLKEKRKILEWMLENNVRTVDSVGSIITQYYRDPKVLMKEINNKATPKDILPTEVFKGLKARGHIK